MTVVTYQCILWRLMWNCFTCKSPSPQTASSLISQRLFQRAYVRLKGAPSSRSVTNHCKLHCGTVLSAKRTARIDDLEELHVESSDSRPNLLSQYRESEGARRMTVVSYLHKTLKLTPEEAESTVAWLPDFLRRGVCAIEDNFVFLRSNRVNFRDIKKDLDLLCLPLEDLEQVHELVEDLPDASFPLYYPFARLPSDLRRTIFVRLRYGANSNIVRVLSDILKQPELHVSRALSQNFTLLTNVSYSSILSSVKLLLAVGISAKDILSKPSILTFSPARIIMRHRECQKRSLLLTRTKLSLSDQKFDQMVRKHDERADHHVDKAEMIAERLGCTPDDVIHRLSARQHLLDRFDHDRIKETATLLEQAGYADVEILSVFPDIFMQRPGTLRQRLELCSALEWKIPISKLIKSSAKFGRSVYQRRRAQEFDTQSEQGNADSSGQ